MRKKYKIEFIEQLSDLICNILKNNVLNYGEVDRKTEVINQINDIARLVNIKIENYYWEQMFLYKINFNPFSKTLINNEKPLFNPLKEFNDKLLLGDFIELFLNNSINKFTFLNKHQREESQSILVQKCNKYLKNVQQKITKNKDNNFLIVDEINKNLEAQLFKNNEILFLMDFNDKETKKYKTIKEKSKNFFKCIRIDEILIDGYITSAIFKKMEKALLNVFDISTLNSNVMFELGYAIAKKLPIIIISSKNQIKIPFNISGLQCIFFNADLDLGIDELISKINKKIKTLNNKKIF